MIVKHNVTGENHELTKEQFEQLTDPKQGGLVDTYTVVDATEKKLPKELNPSAGEAAGK